VTKSNNLWAPAVTHAIHTGDLLRLGRTEAGMPLSELAELINTKLNPGHTKLDAPMLSKIERGLELPPWDIGLMLSDWMRKQECLQRRVGIEPVARRTDPDTSHAAAHSVRDVTLTFVRAWWLAHLYHQQRYPARQRTDFAAWIRFTSENGPHKCSQSGFRTRRRELVDAGYVEMTDQRVELPTGRKAIVWAITDAGREALLKHQEEAREQDTA
jgi:hypothetical protein